MNREAGLQGRLTEIVVNIAKMIGDRFAMISCVRVRLQPSTMLQDSF
jgi:hypothetical protein